MRSLLAPSQGVSPGQQPNTLHIPPLPLLWVVIKLMKAACPISALPAAAWNSSDHPCKTVAGSSPADALEDGGIQLVADELPSKPCAEGALDALTLPGASWSRPGRGLPGQIPRGARQASPGGICHPSRNRAELDAQRGRWRSEAEAGWERESSEMRQGGRRGRR